MIPTPGRRLNIRNRYDNTEPEEKKQHSKAGIYLYISGGGLILLVMFSDWLRELPTEILSRFATIIMLVMLACALNISRRRIWSIPGTYFVVLCLFHFGIPITASFGLLADNFREYIVGWYYSPSTNYAIVLACMGLVSGILGVCIAHLLPEIQTPTESSASDAYEKLATRVGLLLVALSVIGWLWLLVGTNGLAILASPYASYLEAKTTLNLIGWTYFGLCLGMVFLAASRPSFGRTFGFVLCIVYGMIALPMGLRGEILFPLGATLVVLARKRVLISTFQTVTLLIVALSTISALRDIREVGLGKLELSEIQISPVAGINELGSSLRPVTEVVRWHEVMGEDFVYGASYLAPLERQLVYVFPGWRRMPGYLDERLLSVWIQNRVGAIGFSPIAEGYRNFGIVGVILAMFLTGLLLGRMELWPVDIVHELVVGTVFVPILIQTRNDFGHIVPQALIGITILGAMLFLARTFSRQSVIADSSSVARIYRLRGQHEEIASRSNKD